MNLKDPEFDNITERILFGIAIILVAFIMAYNVLYKPDVEVIEFSTDNSEVLSQQDEEYTAYMGKNNVVNLNTASLDDLTNLDGIGEVLAQRIIDYRNEVGEIRSIDELLEIDGIGEAKLETIKDYIIL